MEIEKSVLTDDLGFEYTHALCQAIEAFTSNAEKVDPKAFEYQGANLKYAVERALYFALVNSTVLYDFFIRWKKDLLPQEIELTSEIERDLALCICNNRLRLRIAKIHKLKQKFLRYSYIWGKAWCRKSIVPSKVNYIKENPKVLIYVIHEKFIRYLLPITKRLPVTFAYLTLGNRDLEPLLVENQIPFLDYTYERHSLSYKKPSGVLTNFSDIVSFYNQFYMNLKQLNPKCVLLIEGNAPQNEIVNQVCKQLSVPTACLQQGWSPIIHNGFRNMSFTKMLMWGDGFSDLLKPSNPHQAFISVGNHMLDFDKDTCPGIRRAICFFMQTPGRIMSPDNLDELLNLICWVACEFPHLDILVREHPGKPLLEQLVNKILNFSNVKLVPYERFSLKEVLEASFAAVSIYSSTILESIASGVLPIIFNPTSLPSYFPDVAVMGSAIEIKSLEDAKKVLRRLITEPSYLRSFKPGMDDFRNRFFNSGNKNPVDSVINEISQLINPQ